MNFIYVPISPGLKEMNGISRYECYWDSVFIFHGSSDMGNKREYDCYLFIYI